MQTNKGKAFRCLHYHLGWVLIPSLAESLLSYNVYLDSFTPTKYKVNLIRTITFRCFRICLSPSLLRSCVNKLRKFLLQNGYPAGVINYNINDFLSRQQRKPKNPTTTVHKKEIILVVPVLYMFMLLLLQTTSRQLVTTSNGTTLTYWQKVGQIHIVR